MQAEGLAESPRSDWADSAHGHELDVSRLDHRGDGSKVSEQRPRRHTGDVGDGSEHGLGRGRLRPLGVQRPVAWTPPRATGDAVDPESRVLRRLGSDDGHVVLGGGEQSSANCSGSQRPMVQEPAFDEQERSRSGTPHPSELTPQPPRHECEVQVAHRLALDQGALDPVVAGRELRDPHLRSEPLQLGPNRGGLVHVHVDADHLNPHAKIVPIKTSRVCTYRSREARTT